MFDDIKKYYKLNNKTINLFNSQFDIFNSLKDKIIYFNNNYCVGDDVIIDDKTLIHGTKISVDELNMIKDTGLIAPEFIGEFNRNKKKPFVVEFWKINNKMKLKEFIDVFCGVTLEVKNNDGSIISREMISIDDIKDKIINLNNYRDYVIYQNQEQRFVPNDYNKNSTMAFIVKETEESNELFSNDIFSNTLDKVILKNILPNWFYKKYLINKKYDNYETGRERAIIYGIPSNMIKGILVNREIEKDEEKLHIIKKLFSNCYICNIDGKVIM